MNPKGIILSRRAQQRLRAQRPPVRPGDLRPRRAGPGHLLRHAAGRADPRRAGQAGQAAREYGRAKLTVASDDPLVRGLPRETTVWMSHGDQVQELPADFVALATTPTCPYAAARHATRPFYGVQFHPEVTHTPRGAALFRSFLFDICGCSGTWTMGNFVELETQRIRDQVGPATVICGLSGGVDSSRHRRPAPQGHRQATGLHLRRQRPAAQGRAAAGRVDLRRPLQNRPADGRRDRAVPRPTWPT